MLHQSRVTSFNRLTSAHKFGAHSFTNSPGLGLQSCLALGHLAVCVGIEPTQPGGGTGNG